MSKKPADDRSLIEEAICRSLGVHGEPDRRVWKKMAKTGASDADIIAVLSDQWGLGGASSGPTTYVEEHHGLSNVKLTIRRDFGGKPLLQLKGGALVREVRRLLDIPAPVPAGQLRLI